VSEPGSTFESSPPRAAALAFTAAFATLASQILVHRVVSAQLLNNYAFFVISLTMLGFAGSGVLLSFRPPKRLDETVAMSSVLFAASLVLSCAWISRVDTAGQWTMTRAGFLSAMLRFSPLALFFAVPFGCCGMILGGLLASPKLPTGRIYFFDLVGSATGALAVIPGIRLLGVERSILLVCVLLIVVSFVLVSRTRGSSALLLSALLGLGVVWGEWRAVFPMPKGAEYVAWDPLARIEVSAIPPPDPATVSFPSVVGLKPEFLAHLTRVISQNGFAYTFAPVYKGDPSSMDGVQDTFYATAYETTPIEAPRVLVIGVGGGIDVLTALHFGARGVTGVEVNGATMGILKDSYRDYFRPWVSDPRVTLVNAEGRHYLATTNDKYDVIQLSGVDSYSGTPAAAHVFSESYLYTIEAWKVYLSHLTDDGLVVVMRLEFNPPREMLRCLTTAVTALRQLGVAHPAENVAVIAARSGNFAAVVAKRTPFSPVELDRMNAWTSANPLLHVVASPRQNADRANSYERFLSIGDPRLEETYLGHYGFDVAPVDDDRPFFFKYSYWSHLRPANPAIAQSVPAVEYSLLALTAAILPAAVLAVLVPLGAVSRRGWKVRGATRYAAVCALIGAGYMAIELALLQKFGLFLGHPNYALSVVLAALLFSTGLGSFASRAIVERAGHVRFVAYLLSAVLLAEWGFLFPRLSGLVGLPFWERALIVAMAVAPIGFCLGIFFPAILERLKGEAAPFVPWAWGLNGVASVLAPVWGVAFSMAWGVTALYLSAIPLYLLAGLAFPEASAPSAGARP
jgi:spermidine synthase